MCQIALGTESVDEEQSEMFDAGDVNLPSPHAQQGL